MKPVVDTSEPQARSSGRTVNHHRRSMCLLLVAGAFGILVWHSVVVGIEGEDVILAANDATSMPIAKDPLRTSHFHSARALHAAPHHAHTNANVEVLAPSPDDSSVAVVQLNASCMRRLHGAVAKWMTCVDSSVPAGAGSSRWSHRNPCGFIDVASFQDPLMIATFLANAVEAHGDSTLRELLKLLIGGLKMDGTLEKKDASAALRAPKFFSRWLGKSSVGSEAGGAALSVSRFSESAEIDDTCLVDSSSTKKAINALSPLQQRVGGRSLVHYRAAAGAQRSASGDYQRFMTPLAFRVMFRFDFVPSSFAELLGDAVPLLTAPNAPPANKTVARGSGTCIRGALQDRHTRSVQPRRFFDGDAAQRVVLIATGSHNAKMLATNQSIHSYAKRLAHDKNSFSHGELFRLVIRDTEDYLIRRLLHLTVVRDATSQEPLALHPARTEDVVDATVAPADLVIMFEEALECDSMNEAKLQGFRDMALHCSLMNTLLQRINEQLRAHFFSNGESTTGPPQQVEGMHAHSAIRKLLSESQRATLLRRVVYVPLLDCHGGGKFQYTPSKPYCTRDGIHLRTKFIRKKLSILVNILLGVAKCSEEGITQQ